MEIRCTVRLNKDCQVEIPAILVGFIPAPLTIAIVVLMSFDIGKLYELPLSLVTVDPEPFYKLCKVE